jgi:hypothetical protein
MARASKTNGLSGRRSVFRAGRLALALGLALTATVAAADPPAPSSPSHVPLTWTPMPTAVPLIAGEPTGDGTGLPAAVAVLPLRLSLLDAATPITLQWGADPCGSSGDPAASAAPAFPVQHHAVLALAPRLTLHGFSSGRCAADTGIGGGVTYAAPVAKNWWFVASAGIYGVQAFRPNQSPTLTPVTDARLDLVLRAQPTRPWSFGVSRRGVSVTGAW